MKTNGDAAVKVVPVRHVGRWIGVAGVMVALAMLIHTMFFKVSSAKIACSLSAGVRSCHHVKVWRFQWNIVGQFFFTSEVFHGLLITIELTVVAMIIGIVLGMVIAVMRMSPNRVLSAIAFAYTWFFRGTPVLVQLTFWYYLGALYPHLTIGLPFLHVTFLNINVNNAALTALDLVMLGLGLNEGAYMSEIARAGLISVDEGQVEAASSLGMTRRQTLRLVVLPQAMRVIIPPTGNEVISMLKTSSLASTVSVLELFGVSQNIAASNFKLMPMLILASIWYLMVSTILSIGQFYLERRFAKGALRTPPPTPMQRLRADLRGISAKFRTPRGIGELRT